MTEALADEVAWRNVNLGDTDEVVSGLCAAIESPLGPMVDGVRLRDIARRDRLDELSFEIPLVGGDAPTAQLARRGRGRPPGRSTSPTDDPVARYAPPCATPPSTGPCGGI